MKTQSQKAVTAIKVIESPAIVSWPSYSSQAPQPMPDDHFITRNGVRFAGTHLIVDFWGAKLLTDLAAVESALRASVLAANATLLHIHLHHFAEGGGISGVAVLAESHISVHTWPEHNFAAFDVFMCGNARPELAVEVLKAAFRPTHFDVQEYLRGRQLVVSEPKV